MDRHQEGPRVLGALLTYRRQGLLPGTLRAICDQTRPLDQLLVVDNENSDVTRAIVDQYRKKFPRIEILYAATPTNLGSAGGWAFGMRRLLEVAGDNDWIMPLDDDNPCKDQRDFERMIDFAATTSQRWADVAAVGIIGARLNWRTGRILRLPDEELHGCVPVEWVGTGNIPLYKVAALRRVGLFDERLFFGHTEMEFGLRLRHAGWKVFANGDMWRERRAKAGQIGIVKRRSRVCSLRWESYYSVRNYLYIARRLRRWDYVLRQILIQCLAKPVWTVFTKPSRAVPGFCLALRASIDGIFGKMGLRLEPNDGYENSSKASNMIDGRPTSGDTDSETNPYRITASPHQAPLSCNTRRT